MRIIKYLIFLCVTLELPYANIGIYNKNIGTVSDSIGNFKLKLNKINKADSITVSYIGYQTKEFKVSSLLKDSNLIIRLDPSSTILDNVVIKFKAPKAKKLGRTGKGLGFIHYTFYTLYEDVEDWLSKEMGTRINLKNDCKINALNFNITSNDFKSLKFRINFYNMKNGLPKDLLNTQDIIFEIKNNFSGWYKVDLKPYNLYLEKELKEIVVTIQWLESEKATDDSKWFKISTAKATSKKIFIRNKAMGKWESKKYSPSFYLDAECKY